MSFSEAESSSPRYKAKPTRSSITNHTDMLHGVDGRSAAARRYRDLVLEIVADQGGEID